MTACQNCQTPIEPKELSCRLCGKPAPIEPETATFADLVPSKNDLEESYRSSLQRGKNALTATDFDDAATSLREAVKRSRMLDDAETKEIEARKLLGQALENQSKIPEAADQYRIISQITSDEILREVWLKKSQDLVASSNLSFDRLFRHEDFRSLLEEEVRYVPLYCSGCKRLLAEAEVFGFRRGFSETVQCWCGYHDRPMAKADAQHSKSLEEAGLRRGQRSRAIEAANKELPGGHNRMVACILALTLGWAGAHKFYLGDRVLGWIYVIWCWTLVPSLLSIYEAVVLWHMSLVTFNMTYNLDLVLKDIQPEDEDTDDKQAKLDVFSLAEAEAQQEVI